MHLFSPTWHKPAEICQWTVGLPQTKELWLASEHSETVWKPVFWTGEYLYFLYKRNNSSPTRHYQHEVYRCWNSSQFGICITTVISLLQVHPDQLTSVANGGVKCKECLWHHISLSLLVHVSKEISYPDICKLLSPFSFCIPRSCVGLLICLLCATLTLQGHNVLINYWNVCCFKSLSKEIWTELENILSELLQGIPDPASVQ